MKIRIHSAIFNDASAWRDLDRLFIFIEDKRHEWVINNELELDAFANSSYLDNQPEYKYVIYSELAERIFAKSFNKGKNRQYDIIDINNIEKLKYYVLYLAQPVYIILEHIKNDKHFLMALLRCYKKISEKINFSMSQKDWIVFLHAGGKDGIIPNIQDKLGEIPPRIFFLLDSDTKFLGEPYCENLEKILEFCKNNDTSDTIKYHVTHKREIENYLPESVLSTLMNPEQKAVYEAYCQLNPEQKDFYDLEKGFNDKSIAVGQESLFKDLQEKNKEHIFKDLRMGFAQNKKFDTKKQLPNLFNNGQYVTRDTLNARCAHQANNANELEKLLEKINTLL